MKWDRLQPEKDRYDYSGMDDIANYARKYNLKIYGHTLLWHKNIPSWLEPYLETLPENDRPKALTFLIKDYLQKTITRYKDIIQTWDVLNEVLLDTTPKTKPIPVYRKDSLFFKYLGNLDEDGIPEYVKLAFNFAHEANPQAKLFYNDYHVEYFSSSETNYLKSLKSQNMYNMVKSMIKSNIPIHGVGIQAHITNPEPFNEKLLNKDEIKDFPLYKTISAYQKLEVEVRITEMDVLLYKPKNEAPSLQDLEKQANTYQNYLLACLQFNNCVGFTVWNFSDKHVWCTDYFPGKKEDYHPNLFDRNYQPKPAYFALLKLLKEE